jgi:capsular polysaccharide biosynthesis protein
LIDNKGNGSTIFVLITKREESAISLSAAEPKISVIDSADTDSTPVFPLKGMIYFGGLVLGLLSFRIIYTDDLLDTKIKKPFGYRGKNDYSIWDVPTSDFL